MVDFASTTCERERELQYFGVLYNNIYIVEFNMALVVRNRIPHRTIL